MSDSLSNGFLPQHARHIKPNLDATAIKLFNRAVVITESSLWAMSTRNAGGTLTINTTLQVSNFGDADLVGSMVTWKVETVLGERVCHVEPAAIHTPVPVGANTQVGQAVCTVPRPKPGAPPVAEIFRQHPDALDQVDLLVPAVPLAVLQDPIDLPLRAQVLALKQVKLDAEGPDTDGQLLQAVRNEIELMESFKHQNLTNFIIKLVDAEVGLPACLPSACLPVC